MCAWPSVPGHTVSRNDSMDVPACECDSGPRRLGARPRGPEQGRRARVPRGPPAVRTPTAREPATALTYLGARAEIERSVLFRDM